MKISIIIEGKTEQAFMPYLREFLKTRLPQRMPKPDPFPCDGRIPQNGKWKRMVEKLLQGKKPSDHVIALTDVYTGTNPPDFTNAQDAKNKMRQWVENETRFHPHAAQYDFEAWLLPYWPTILRLAQHNKTGPTGNPEEVNHNTPPSHRIKEVFRIGQCRQHYIKPRDAGRILRDNNLSVAIDQCSELKSFINTILLICGGPIID